MVNRTLFYVNIYGTVHFFGPTVYVTAVTVTLTMRPFLSTVCHIIMFPPEKKTYGTQPGSHVLPLCYQPI